MPHARAELQRGLEALTAASLDAVARLQQNDETGVAELLELRERFIATLADAPLQIDAGVMEIARRALALDTELVTMLRTRLAHVSGELDEVARTRRSLTAYGAARPSSAVYVERLG
jgi:hypothetical protein